ncbi:hypothetical protein [Streptomyces barkulensis]|uniref:hypothetical protein n=1 Tax=Streptomyces barkulensis TaxID=1257026 RepID=UPI000C6E3987|nr:hypothetical protein [Streptomyces barkulensis]
MGTRRRTKGGNEARTAPGGVGADRVLAAFASMGAAAIHVAAAADHYDRWWISGLFFYATGAFQAGWSVIALRTGRPSGMVIGLLVNVAVIVTWAVSRTVGVPVGPGAGVPEHIGRAGVTAVAFEVVVCLVAARYVRRRAARGFTSSLRAVVLAGVAASAVTGVTVPAVESAVSHSHGTAEEPSAPHGHGDGGGGEGHGEDGDGAPEPDAGTASTQPAERPADGGQDGQDGQDGHGGDGHDDGPHGH